MAWHKAITEKHASVVLRQAINGDGVVLVNETRSRDKGWKRPVPLPSFNLTRLSTTTAFAGRLPLIAPQSRERLDLRDDSCQKK